jgi:hypothetical protein
MKLYDFDTMFDDKLSEYISKNSGKYTESEWGDVIPRLYKEFGDTYIKAVGDTPNGFFAKFSDEELVSALRKYLKNGVAVSEFLCNAIESRDVANLLLPLLDGSEDEREYAMNLLGSDEKAVAKYMEILVDKNSGEDMKNRCVDFIKEKADLVLPTAIDYYKKGIEREYMLEIMSRTVLRDDRIFDILISEFRNDPENIPMHASYLAAYGDERAIEYLLDKIDEDGITFIEYQELKFAIESLGGEYTKERDFSSDPYYQAIKTHSTDISDIFEAFNKKD